MASAAISESQASPFPSPSSSFIPQTMSTPAHDNKRLSVLTPAGEIGAGAYHNAQRNSTGAAPQTNSGTLLKRPSAEGYLTSDSQSAETSSSSSLGPLSPTTPTPTIAVPSPLLSSSSAFDPATCTCHLPCIHIPTLSPSPAQSPSPATSAFKTPASSFTEISSPPSPSRPAPASPAISRRGSGLSLKQRTQSRRQSGLAIEVMPSPMDVDPPGQSQPFNTSAPTAFATETETETTIPPAPPNSAATAAAETVLTPTTPSASATSAAFPAFPAGVGVGAGVTAQLAGEDDGPLIIVRDYGFAPTDDRFHGRGPFVPKWNKLSRLNRILAGRPSESDSDVAGNNKQKEKKKKKRRNVNGWSDSDSDVDMDLGDKRYGGLGSSGGGTADDEDDGGGGSPVYEFGGGGGGGGGGGWGALGLGRFNWLGASFLPDGGARGTAISVPSQMELERNFGQLDDGGDGDMEEEEEEEYPFDQEPEQLAPGSYRALYVFEAVGDAEMGLEEGQIVTVTGKGRGDGWAVVHDTREGKEGGHALVPESYLELVQLDA